MGFTCILWTNIFLVGRYWDFDSIPVTFFPITLFFYTNSISTNITSLSLSLSLSHLNECIYRSRICSARKNIWYQGLSIHLGSVGPSLNRSTLSLEHCTISRHILHRLKVLAREKKKNSWNTCWCKEKICVHSGLLFVFSKLTKEIKRNVKSFTSKSKDGNFECKICRLFSLKKKKVDMKLAGTLPRKKNWIYAQGFYFYESAYISK